MSKPGFEKLVEDGYLAASGYAIRPLMARSRNAAGSYVGNEPGSSLEFHEYRPYQPGDDLRRVDWGVYARSDSLVVRQYRVELSPIIEIHLDVSRSMGVYTAKAAASVFLAAFLAGVTTASEGQPVLVAGGLRYRAGEIPAALTNVAFSRKGDFEESGDFTASARRPVVILISDFLFPGADHLLKTASSRAAHIEPIMVLSKEERKPNARGAVRFVEVENENKNLDVRLDNAALKGYQRRLEAHLAELDRVAQRHRTRLIRLDVPNQFRAARDLINQVTSLATRSDLVEPR